MREAQEATLVLVELVLEDTQALEVLALGVILVLREAAELEDILVLVELVLAAILALEAQQELGAIPVLVELVLEVLEVLGGRLGVILDLEELVLEVIPEPVVQEVALAMVVLEATVQELRDRKSVV